MSETNLLESRSRMNSAHNDPPMRLAVILPDLGGGGTERMRLNLIEEWQKRGIQIDLVLGRNTGSLIHLVPDGISVFEVARRHKLFFPFGLAAYLLRYKPTHVLSAPTDVSVIALLLGFIFRGSTKTIVSVHDHFSTEYSAASGGRRLKARVAYFLFKHLIRSAHALIAVSEGVANDLRYRLQNRHPPISVILNPTITRKTLALMQAPFTNPYVSEGTPYILFAGRLTPQKAPELLVEAFSTIVRKTQAHLVLIGEGELRATIQAAINLHGISDRVHLAGFQQNPLPWMQRAALLVLPSRHEGLPNVLIESLACGTQVISTNCPSGPDEILDGGRFGQLVPVGDVAALAAAMLRSLNGEFHVEPEALKARAADFNASRAADAYLTSIRGDSMPDRMEQT